MGLETKTTAIRNGEPFTGRLHVDSQKLEFSGKGLKWSLLLGAGIKAAIRAGRLEIVNGRDRIAFEVGEDGERWVQKILNPPGRMVKLGVKSGMACWVSPGFEKSFLAELRAHGAKVVRAISDAGLAFLMVTDRKALDRLAKTVEALPPGVNLWIAWPKGSESIGQSDVMQSARDHGFGPSKTAAFDDGHSSLRFARKK